MTDEDRSSITIHLHHRTIKPPDLGSPLNRKTPQASYRLTLDKDLLDRVHKFLQISGKEIIDEVVTTSCPENGYTKIETYFGTEVPSESIHSLIERLQQAPIEVSIQSIKFLRLDLLRSDQI
jgi:hypothetical protein